jgi:hypothetical protein
VRNNIFYLYGWHLSLDGGFEHEHNLYAMRKNAHLGVTPSMGEIVADPEFVDRENHDYRLQATSPAIDAAIPLGHQFDYEGQSVPMGAAPDIGAFEYGGVPAQTNPLAANDPTMMVGLVVLGGALIGLYVYLVRAKR